MIALLVLLLIANGGLVSNKVQPAPVTLAPEVHLLFHVPAGVANPQSNTAPFVRVGDQVVLSLIGTLYDPPHVVDAADAGTDSPAAVVAGLRESIMQDDYQTYVRYMTLREREGLTAYLVDNGNRQRLHRRALEHASTAIVGEVKYLDYTLELVRYNDDESDLEIVVVTAQGDRWLATQALQRDPVYDHLLASFVLGNYGVAPASARSLAPPAATKPDNDAMLPGTKPAKAAKGDAAATPSPTLGPAVAPAMR